MTDGRDANWLHARARAEKRQALYYRALAAAAEDVDDAELSERLNGCTRTSSTTCRG
jgi:hypothetical protein